MTQRSRRITTALIFSALFLAACGRKDIDKVGDAQNCLDTSSRSNVSTCVEKVAGLETPGSYVIRCAASFISEGFDDVTRLTTALSNMTNSGTGASGVSASVAVMGVLAFKNGGSTAQNLANATLAQTYCAKSGSKGLILLASIASFATTVLGYAADPSSILNGLATAKDSTAAQALVGTAVLAAYTSNCTSGQTSNQQFCSQFTSVVGSAGTDTSAACIGKQAMYYYSGTTTTCP
jgi:hypothetical protein